MMDVPDMKEIQDNPFILSDKLPVGQKSFIDDRQSYNKLAPPPKYFTDDYLLKSFGLDLPVDKDDVFKGFDFPKEGGLICTNKEMIKRQSGVLGHVVK